MAAATPINVEKVACSDVFSMTDDLLAQRYRFCREYGVGNWGTVWLGQDKRCGKLPEEQKKVAIKLVHRSKTQATAVKVRALWNEMKVVRPLREERHPSLVQFHEFIISPSYALIIMEFLPKALPVPVPESKAKLWLLSLSSAIEFLHSRGVVHNDIKPANILLSGDDTPKFVDFGFADQYDLESPDAFHSSLAYGTPEYLSPERAKGQVHDTRKSDVWSLGITFFEIIMGRTPFEKDKGEHFISKEELDVYWKRTYRGKWLATGTEQFRSQMSKGLEALLRKMLAPNADVRITAAQVMRASYWSGPSILQETVQTQTRPTINEKQAGTAAKTVARKLSLEGRHNKENSSPRSRLTRSQRRTLSPTNRANSVAASQDLKRPTPAHDKEGSTSDTSNNVPLSPRPRANDIFILTGKKSFDGQLAIGYSADLNAPYTPKQPARCLRHIASDQYPFNERSIDGVAKPVVIQNANEREVRRTKSEVSVGGTSTKQPSEPASNGRSTHQRTPSYNSLYLGRSGMKTIPEVRIEDMDEQTQVEGADAAATDTEAYYHQLLANTMTVEQVGKGYQSKLCTRNDVVSQKKPDPPSTNANGQPEVERQTPVANFFLSVRESHSGRPKRKVRQAASFDGFGERATRRESLPQRPRPTSAHITTTQFDGHSVAKEREPKKSVAETVRKAFLVFLGVSERRTKRD